MSLFAPLPHMSRLPHSRYLVISALVSGLIGLLLPGSGWGAVQLAQAKSLIVTLEADHGPGTLRDALRRATSGDVITFRLSKPRGNLIILTSGPLIISTDVIVDGPGAAVLTIDGSNADRIFYVNQGEISLSGMTLSNGQTPDVSSGGAIYNARASRLRISNCVINGNTASGNGGAITNDGDLILVSDSITNNTGNTGGGGVYNTGTLSINDTRLINNTAGNYGGGIYNTGSLSILNSTISGNRATTTYNIPLSMGGGIANTGSFSLVGSTISANQASSGGGILNTANLIITNSTITNNLSSGKSDSSSPMDDGGGGIDNSADGNVSILSSTISGNATQGKAGGGGLFNRAGIVTLHSTIIADNSGKPGTDVAGPVTSQGYNLIGQTDVMSPWLESDQENIDPLLGTLIDNGGLTATEALSTTSPAIGAGGTGCPLTDQRGKPRKRPCDIGAYESQP